MDNFDDFDDFGDFDFNSEEANEEYERRQRERENHPLVKKAREIDAAIDSLMILLSDEDREMCESTLTESSMIINAKLAGAIGSESWLVCMQNAAIIREHAQYLKLSNHMLRDFSGLEERYVGILRNVVEEFQIEFVKWIKSLEMLDDEGIDDEWGLFIRNKK